MPLRFDGFLRIAHLGIPAQSLAYRTIPIRSRAFRRWPFDQSLSSFENIPPGDIRAIGRFATQNLKQPPQPIEVKELIPT